MNKKLKLGISACLLGHKVRYDGGHKLEPLLVETLGQYVQFVPVCPEVEAGLTVPREPAHLEGPPGSARMITQKTGNDITDQVLSGVQKRLEQLSKENLCGFVFKSNSPSCEIKGGIFARAFSEYFPHIPTATEKNLRDKERLGKFIQRALKIKS
ncbi:MAG: DUF523 domain-containing protein [Candidatus Aminicenantes bacterium]|nr:DUF523 domain-containing protein [Candidatus Aminicenantes bacterium]